MKIGILQCDDVAAPLRAVHGNYPDMFMRWLRTADPELDFTNWRCHDGEFPQTGDEADAWLITGSKYGVNDDLPWIARLEEFIRLLHQRRRPLVGICFGHQMIGRALGGAVRQHPDGWGVGVKINTLKHQQSWMQPWKPKVNLLVSHQDQVYQAPSQSVVLAENDLCPVYMVLVDATTLGLQGHPEFSKAYARDLMERQRGVIPDEVLEAGLESLDTAVDDKLLAVWVLNFLSTAGKGVTATDAL